ncbi:unnamed protein product [Oreochromis niloticus]|nr:unnamed protein product [Mustela putorius furo]
MAAPEENLLSLGRLNGSEKNTFTKERQFCGNKSVNKPVLLQDDPSPLHSQEHLVMHLQQRWQELKEREYTAQQQNRQLLQQFERAQDTLKEMLARNAAMKMIRMEYERYLEENSPRWQQQLKEKRQAAQKKKMDDYLKSCLKNTDVMKSSAGPPTEPQKTATPQGYTDYNQDGSSHLPHTQSSWLSRSQSQIARFPARVPPIIPHPYPLYYPASAPGQYHHPWPRQDLQGRASLQPDYPWYLPAGATGTPSYSEALWGQLYMEEPLRDSRVSQTVGEEDKMSRVLSSQRERSVRSSSSRSSHELDVKPVRLSSSHSESSESGRDSSKKAGKEEKGGRKQRVSSDRERCSPQELSGNSSAIFSPTVGVAQSSESNASSEKSLRSSSRRTKKTGDLSVQSPGSQKEAEERTVSKGGDSEIQDTGEESGSLSETYEGEKAGNQNHEEKTNRCKESGSQKEKESESDSAKNKNDDAGEVEEQDSSSAEQSSTGEKVKDKTEENLEAEEDCEEKEKSQKDKEQDDSDIKQGDGASAKDATEEEAETSTDDEIEEQGGEEQSIRLKNEGTENRKQGAASSQDEEDGSEGSEEVEDEDSNQQEDDKSEEEEHGSEEDQIDSDNCIVTPQEKRSTQIITDEAAQEQEEGKTGSDNDDSNEVSDEDDIENLLAPQEETQEKEKYLRAEEKPKASFPNMGIFQVEHDKSKTEDPNDSDEFDHFYD